MNNNDAFEFQHLFDTYVGSYDDVASTDSTRMVHAQTLSLALLQHYYPESQGYMVQPSTLGPIARYGMNFLLKAEDGSDPDFNLLPPKKNAKKSKRKKATKTQLEKAEFARQFGHGYPLLVATRWHTILPENIAAFEVLKRSATAGADDEYQPYTFLAILIDDLKMFPSFAATNDVNRGDILASALCRTGKIRSGYGILLFGTRLEFYDFDNGEEMTINGSASDDFVEGMVTIEEPSVALATANQTDLVMDMRTMGLHAVEEGFRVIGDMNVVYLDDGADVADGQDVEVPVEQQEVIMGDIGDMGDPMGGNV